MTNILEYLISLEADFRTVANTEIAYQQKKYLRNKFDFFGIKSPKRRLIQRKYFKKNNLPLLQDLFVIVKMLWNKPQREYQYFAQELVLKFFKKIQQDDLYHLEYMITHKSWWDTVDYISTNLVGGFFMIYPSEINIVLKKWLKTDNIWLHRSAILFQLKYKEKTDEELLSKIIISTKETEEFFINKAIGWALREYSKTNPAWVLHFIHQQKLSPLSKREAQRILDSTKKPLRYKQ